MNTAAAQSTRRNGELMEAALKAAREGLEQFAYAAAHDLRGPLGQIRTLTALLVKKHQKNLDEDGRVLCGHIAAAAEHATVLVDALHAYSQAISAPLDPTRVDTGQLFREACSSFQRQIESTGAAVICEALPELTADAGKMTELFRQLIDNALKFRSSEAPRIHVSAAAEPGAYRFGICDNGIGIPARFLQEVFKPLRRLNGYHYAGAGIGLAICRHIVELHGGTIWVESEPERGSVFYFTIASV